MATLNETDLMLHQLERSVQMAHAALLSHARHLAEQMTRLAVRLEAEGSSASVNALGEVQAEGLNVDRGCALLRAEREASAFAHLLVNAARSER
jgi:hypothetical protein